MYKFFEKILGRLGYEPKHPNVVALERFVRSIPRDRLNTTRISIPYYPGRDIAYVTVNHSPAIRNGRATLTVYRTDDAGPLKATNAVFQDKKFVDPDCEALKNAKRVPRGSLQEGIDNAVVHSFRSCRLTRCWRDTTSFGRSVTPARCGFGSFVRLLVEFCIE